MAAAKFADADHLLTVGPGDAVLIWRLHHDAVRAATAESPAADGQAAVAVAVAGAEQQSPIWVPEGAGHGHAALPGTYAASNSTCTVPAASSDGCLPSSGQLGTAQEEVAPLFLWHRSSTETALVVSASFPMVCRASAAELILQLYPGCLCRRRPPCRGRCKAFQPVGVRSPAQRPPLLPQAAAQHAAAEPAADRGQCW